MKALVLLYSLIPAISLGQNISLDFENKDLTGWYQSISGHWTITNDDPVAGQYSLQHNFNSETTSKDWIALFHNPLLTKEGNAVWQFSLRYDFNPSFNNKWAIFLTKNSLPETNLTDAIVLGVNYEGNSDEIKLWRVENNEITCTINTGLNWEENSLRGENINFRLSSLATGEFIIDIDTSGGIFNTIATESINLPDTINVFALNYSYTSAFDRGLTFDDLEIQGNFMVDYSLPVLESISIINPQTLDLVFSEIVKIYEGQEFCVENTGCISALHLIAKSFLLELPEKIIPGKQYFIYLPEIEDLYGNNNFETQASFYYPKAYDVIINEIFADPSPPVLLPEIEYIELLNRSDQEISITGWQFSANNSRTELPDKVISSGEYLVLINAEDENSYYKGLNTLVCNDFPKLNNTGSKLKLQDRSGMLIYAIEYKDEWYKTYSKKEGGWSLEMKDPDDPCSIIANWQESENYRGGTPGEKNSVFESCVFHASPELWRAAITEIGSLMLYFSEPLDSIRSMSSDYFTVDHGIGNPDTIIPSWPVLDKTELFFSLPFRENQGYEIFLTSDLCDCSGNSIQAMENLIFSSSSRADSADIVINEIMFNPEHGFTEYIELYNHTDKTIDIRNFSLVIGENNDTLFITHEYFPVHQDEYVIIAKEYMGIDTEEIFSKAERIVYMNNMPALPNSGSKIYLLTNEGGISDIASYSSDYHNELLSETSGVALERTSWKRSGLDPDNWKSASSDAGYQTPAAINSQTEIDDSKYELEVFPKAITPDGDGVNDELKIHYEMKVAGFMVRIMVFDKNGEKIFTIANGDLIGTDGEYVYLGKDNTGSSLPSGYYILFFEAYHKNGSRYVEKKSFVIARNQP